MTGLPDLITEAGIWELVRPILNKWPQGIPLTEDDAQTLLECFEDVGKPDHRPAPPTMADRDKRVKRVATTHPRSSENLTVLALALRKYFALDKDLRTLRRWCEQGIIPGARKTKRSGHWRVTWTEWTPQQMRALAERVGGHARMPKTLLRSRRWKNFEKKMRPVWTEYITLLFDLDAELRGAASAEPKNRQPPQPTDEAMRLLVALYQGGNQAAMRHLKFRLEARRLYLAGKKLTFQALANRVGISRRTMFKRYQQQANHAISSAATLLTPDDRPEAISETLHDQVVSHFGDEAEKGTSYKRRIPKTQG